MSAIVLDKCFLQAAPWQQVCALAEEHDLILTGSLFYELLTGTEKDRARAFAKLPRKENPVHLLDNVSSLLKFEDEHHAPARDILSHTIQIRYRFNPGLIGQQYELPEEAKAALKEKEQLTHRLVDSYVARTNAVVDMFHRVTKGSDHSRNVALREIEAELAEPDNVIAFYRSIDDPKLPPADLLTPEWTTFRFYQTSLIFSLHTIHRHRGPIPVPLTSREFDRLEHDVHDAMALCTGLLANGLATNERKLIGWWKLLSAGGILVSI